MREKTNGQVHNVALSLALRLFLFAALAEALRALCGVTELLPVFLPGAAAVCLCVLLPKRWGALARMLLALAVLLVFALLPAARDGAALLANRLMAASEAVNAYAYRYYAAAEDAGALRLALILASVLLGVVSSLGASRVCAVAIFVCVAFAEAYFGVTPGLWRNLLLFAALALQLVCGGSGGGSALALLAGLAVVTLAVLLLVPRPVSTVETASEKLRDLLGAAAVEVRQQPTPTAEETSGARQESRLREEPANADARKGSAREFEKQTENEQEISLPERHDPLQAILWALLALVLLVGPFLPFLFFNRARRRTEERRAAFAAEDNAAAICAMFRHTVDWLREGGLKEENRPFSQYGEAVGALTSADCAARYAEAVPIWQEAAYSGHEMSDEQRRQVRELLELTAATLYEKADRRTRFRMKYLACLSGG